MPDAPTGVSIVQTVIGSVEALGGAALVYLGVRRKQNSADKATAVAGDKVELDAEARFIDQLQRQLELNAEEITQYRKESNDRADTLEQRLAATATLADAYRTYAHKLRGHIYDGSPPPPPEWPDGLPM